VVTTPWAARPDAGDESALALPDCAALIDNLRSEEELGHVSIAARAAPIRSRAELRRT
jgi:hypothetical protein